MLDAEVVCTHNMNQIQCFNPEGKLCVCVCVSVIQMSQLRRFHAAGNKLYFFGLFAVVMVTEADDVESLI